VEVWLVRTVKFRAEDVGGVWNVAAGFIFSLKCGAVVNVGAGHFASAKLAPSLSRITGGAGSEVSRLFLEARSGAEVSSAPVPKCPVKD